MSFQAEVLYVLIASPSDVNSERNEVETAIHEWNSMHAEHEEIVLLPRRWENNVSPTYAKGNPQGVINIEIVEPSDIIIGIFGLRFGSPTNNDESGTLEEINYCIEKEKEIMIYFVKKDPYPGMDYGQAYKVDEFKKNIQVKGFILHIRTSIKLSLIYLTRSESI